MKYAFVSAALFLSVVANASVPGEQAYRIEQERQGELPRLILEKYSKEYAVTCDEMETAVTECSLLASSSANEEKTPTTAFNFVGRYLISQKCLSGATFVGVDSNIVKAVMLKGSFRAHYKDLRKGFQPKKLEDVKINFLSEVPALNGSAE